MANGHVAERIASGELRTLADSMFAQAASPPSNEVCSHHAMQARATGCLLIGMDELLQRRSPWAAIRDNWPIILGLCLVVASGTYGIALAIARVSGFSPPAG